ncbi:Cytochrome P450 [Rhypophila sp. PSN 637]
MPYKILALHEKYGPIVRIAPNEVSFSSSQSWSDIYGFRPGHKTFIKSDFYEGGSFSARGVHSMGVERNVEAHAQMRRHLSHAFSSASLAEQEVLVVESIDKFIRVIGERGSETDFNLTKGFGMLAFDIIGDLAFGETFGGLESGEAHPWISISLGALKKFPLIDAFRRFPALGSMFMTLMPGMINKLIEQTHQNEEFSISLVKKRIARHDASRKDFMTRILDKRDVEKVSDLQLAAYASDFVLGGSETTATTLSCIVYYLLKKPDIMAKLKREIRTRYQSYGAMDSASVIQLPYLKAVILEGMRIFPPVPFALPRIVPEGGDEIDGCLLPAGTIVGTNPVAAAMSTKNFSEPFEFSPERWLKSSTKETKEGLDILGASQPFSLGARGCIGINLAWLEMRTTLAKLLWKYDFSLVNQDLDWQRDSTMCTFWNIPELWVRVKEASRE